MHHHVDKVFLTVLAGVILYVIWNVASAVRGLLNKNLVPMIHLVPKETPKNKKFEEACGAFLNAGFKDLGSYIVTELKVHLRAFTKPMEHFVGVVYLHQIAGVWTNVVVAYEDGSGLTLSNAPAGGNLDHRPGQIVVTHVNSTVEQLIAETGKLRKEGPYKDALTGKEFVNMFEESWAKDWAWRKSRGGATVEEIKRIAQEKHMKLTDEMLEAAHAEMQEKMEKYDLLPCSNGGKCPYEDDKGMVKDIEGMPYAMNNPKSCPEYDHICPAFMGEYKLTPADLGIRASLYRGIYINKLVKEGKVAKDSVEYTDIKERCAILMEQYPEKDYPQYYGEISLGDGAKEGGQ
jgi:hypothetical protein